MKSFYSILFIVGSLLVLLGAASYITRWSLSPYLYSLGALLVAFVQFITPSSCQTLVVKRLRRQQLLAALLLLLTGAFMFLTRGNEWIVSLTIAAIIELYTAIRIPQEESKA